MPRPRYVRSMLSCCCAVGRCFARSYSIARFVRKNIPEKAAAPHFDILGPTDDCDIVARRRRTRVL